MDTKMINSRFAIGACFLTLVCFISAESQAAAFPQSSSQKSATKQGSETKQGLETKQGSTTKQGSSTKATEDGFESLLSNNDLSKFRGYKKEAISPAWTVTDKVLRYDGVKRTGDIITKESYKNFDLRFEWKVSQAGNSGVFYHVGLGDGAASKSGIEYQVLDNDGHKDGKSELTSAGSIYALYPPKAYPKKAVGEWNQGRIVCKDSKIMHYLNGVLVAEADTSSDDWKQRLAGSKFSTWKRFASQTEGHIAFQDHGDEVWFQNIKIKKLADTATMPAKGSGSH